MKILILARGIPNSKDPQEGCFEMDQAVALSKLGHEVVIMSVDGRFRKYWRKIGVSKVCREKVVAYKLFVFPTSVIKRLISYKLGYRINSFLAKKMYKYIISKHGTFDIVHAHFLPIIYLGVQIKKDFPSIKLIGTEHWSKVGQKTLSEEVKYLGDASYKFLDKLIVVSSELGANINKNFSVNSEVVHNLIDVSSLKKIPNSHLHDNYTIVGVGSLIHRKGFDILIKAFAKTNLSDKGVTLKIIGDGKEKNNLIELVRYYNLENNVILMGQLTKDRVYEELIKSDLYVLSSRLENFSVAIIEAAAGGLPAIATLCGGVAEFPLKTVIKIPVDNVDSMADAILKAYNDRNNIDRFSIQEECLSYFSPEAIGHQLELIYSKL